MSLTLLGDVLLSVFLTLVADGIGRRRILLAGSVLMVLSGAMFAIFENFWMLLFAAVVGVISITGGDFGPFRAIEESTLSHLTTPKTRADVLSWYVTTASLGSSFGTEASGRIVDLLLQRRTVVDAYHTIFWIYSAMGGLGVVLTLMLSEKCEIEKVPLESEESEILLQENDPKALQENGEDGSSSTSAPKDTSKSQQKSFAALFTQISPETRSVMYKLWFLLIIDSLADGMVPYSLTNYYLDQKFHLPKSSLGDITSLSYLLSSCSTIFAGPLARRLGLIKTMVFTHIPSSAAVLFFPLPSGLWATVILFFIRTGLNNMDQGMLNTDRL
jgi:MFS family permease